MGTVLPNNFLDILAWIILLMHLTAKVYYELKNSFGALKLGQRWMPTV